MNKEDNELNKINNYLEKYFDNWLIKDIKDMQNCNLKFTLPYVLLVSAGIDFLGGLILGFEKGNSPERSEKFIINYMSKFNPLYIEKGIPRLIYDSLRNGASHYSMYKKYVSCSSYTNVYPLEKHLYLDIRIDNDCRIIIQVFQFIEDFIKAYNHFKKDYINKHPKDVYNRLKSMFDKNEEYAENAIKNLKRKNLTYYHKNKSTIQVDSSSPSKIKIIGTSSSPSEADIDNNFKKL